MRYAREPFDRFAGVSVRLPWAAYLTGPGLPTDPVRAGDQMQLRRYMRHQ